MFKKIILTALLTCIPVCSIFAEPACGDCEVHYLPLSSEKTTSFTANVSQDDLMNGKHIFVSVSAIGADGSPLPNISDVEFTLRARGGYNDVYPATSLAAFRGYAHGFVNAKKTYDVYEANQDSNNDAALEFLFYRAKPSEHAVAKVEICRTKSNP